MHLLAASFVINQNLPGVNNVATAGPGSWISSFYNFALLASGIIAFGSIVYGGFKYATSVGDPHRQSDGRSWIWSALIGLLLLGGAWVILHTVNPNLTNLQIGTLSALPN